jgi:hypothetical protein
LNVELINDFAHNSHRVIGGNQLIKVRRQKHALLLAVGLERNVAVVALFHTREDNSTNANDSY